MSTTSSAKGEEIDDQAQEKWESKLSALEVPRSAMLRLSQSSKTSPANS